MQRQEPDIQQALGWWRELPSKWTSVGWKNSLFRFNVLYNGAIYANPHLNRRTLNWEGQGLQLGIWPSESMEFPGHVICPQDQGMIIQGWEDNEAPVLFSEWAREGVVFRSSLFAHVPTGAIRGDEPLFGWLRLAISDIVEGLPVPEKFGFTLCLNAPYIHTGAMSIGYNLDVRPDQRKYPRTLTQSPPGRTAIKIVEPDGGVRLGLVGGSYERVYLSPESSDGKDFLIHISMNTQVGSHVDVLVPIYPVEDDVFESEASLGYNKALFYADTFWEEQRPRTVFRVPEAHITQSISSNLKQARIIAERDPATLFDSLLTGGWVYADMWGTVAAMTMVMLLDAMGCHKDVKAYLLPFAETQGTPLPKGKHWKAHSGSLGAIPEVAACDWASDHGAILWAMAEHGLVTDDDEFIEEFLPVILKACQFIYDSRRINDHPGVQGLLPPGMATDMPTEIQAVWNDGWNYRGLLSAVRLLQRLRHEDAEKWKAEAEDYRQTFLNALESARQRKRSWKDDDGASHKLVPLAVWGESEFEERNAFYLDTGPMCLAFMGLVAADSTYIQDTLRWFRSGPPSKVYRYDGDCWQVPSLHHEISSCEPAFSWNVPASFLSCDRARFIEGMYSLFTGSISRQTYTVCETRGGVTAVSGAHMPAWMARLAVVDDQSSWGELHLLQFTPHSWLQGSGITIEALPTYLGPIDLAARVENDTLIVTFSGATRYKPDRCIVHIPDGLEVENISVNGKSQTADSGQVVLC